jgi:hypothetical protein
VKPFKNVACLLASCWILPVLCVPRAAAATFSLLHSSPSCSTGGFTTDIYTPLPNGASRFQSCGVTSIDFFGTPYQVASEGRGEITLTSIKASDALLHLTVPAGLDLVGVASNDIPFSNMFVSVTDLITVFGVSANGVIEMEYDVNGTVDYPGNGFFVGSALTVFKDFTTEVGRFQYDSRWSGVTPSGIMQASVPYTVGVPFYLTTTFQAYASGYYLSGPVNDVSVITDYFNTITLQPITVLDSNSQVVPLASVSSDTGFAYPLAVTAIPEPGNWFCAVGALSLILFRIRARSRSASAGV